MQEPRFIVQTLLEKSSWSREEQDWLLHYLHHEDAPELRSLLLEQFSLDLRQDVSMPADLSEKLLQQIQQQIAMAKEQKKGAVSMSWKRFAAAAAVVLIVLSGSYFLFSNNKSPQPLATTGQAEVVLAASSTNTAAITLANGQQVILDETPNGTLALQGNVTITKTGNGQIVYKGTANEVAYNTLHNPRGSKAVSITLADGTTVLLNAASTLRYPTSFTGKERKVEMVGEGFFDVVKTTKHPFIIHTSKMDIKVLGTRFNVKAYKEDKTTETSLIKGSVEVSLLSNPLRKYLLKPNQKLILLNNLPAKAAKDVEQTALTTVSVNSVEIKPLTYLPGTETNIESSWTKNLLSFEDEAFVDVARRMERLYNVSIEFKNKRWENKFLSGSFEKESLETALKTLKYTTGFDYKIDHNNIAIY